MNNSRKRLNYVDLLLALVALVLLSIFITINFKDSAQVDFSQKETVTLTLRVKNIPIKHSGLIKNRDTVYFSNSEESAGIIKYVSYDSETVEFLDKLTNTATTYKSPDKKTALILIESKADYINDEYLISGRKISVGDSLELYVPEFSFEATVINLENNKE